MNILRSLEQNRADFAYNLLKGVVDLRNCELIERLNGIFRLIFNEDVAVTPDEFEELRTNRKKDGKIEKKNIFNQKFQKALEDKLSSYIGKSPTMILVNGLGNTMVFYISKIESEPKEILEKVREFKKAFEENIGKSDDSQALKKLERSKKEFLNALKPDRVAYLILYEAVNNWLKKMSIIESADNILEWFKDDKISSLDVLHATKETIELLKWLKRFANAMLEKGE